MKPWSHGRKFFAYLLVVVIILAVWHVLALAMGEVALPRPASVLKAFAVAVGTKGFWLNFKASAFRVVCATVIAWAAAFPLGVLMGGFKRLDNILSPFVFLTYPVPKIVFLPIFLILLGLGDMAKIAMISLILGYQVLVTTRDGAKLVNSRHVDSIRSLGGGKLAVLTEALIPAALPSGFTSLRLGTGVSVAVLFFVESFATNKGLGYLIMDAWGRMDYDNMFVGIIGMSMLGVGLYEAINVLERIVCPWKKD